ncbi:MAG: hypothetical protein EBW68_09480, partial [Actinobacteria bacterium]|nr:hypothetical protein [Actinomycetota bacterium]
TNLVTDLAGKASTSHTHSYASVGSTTPSSVSATNTVGTSAEAARVDHTHSGVTSITGTSNQVIASASSGSVTLSLPQSIATTSTPTFGATTINGIITANKSGHTGVNQGILLASSALTITTTTMPSSPTTANTQLISWTSATKANTTMWSSGGSITLPLAGMYMYVFGSRFGSGASYSVGAYAFQGSTLRHHVSKDASSTSSLDNFEMSGMVYATGADTLSIRIAASAASKTLSANTFLGVMYLGDF